MKARRRIPGTAQRVTGAARRDVDGDTLSYFVVTTGNGSASGAAADARGLSRPFDVPGAPDADDGCDAGAYEVHDDDGDGMDDAPEVFIFADVFESGDASAWGAVVP